MKTPLTKARLRQHWQYSWWKYLLLVVLALGGWNILFAVTAYRPPAEKIVDLYVYGYADTEKLGAYLAKVREEQLPEMEQMNAVEVLPDETYGSMVLATRLAAAEGDLYVLPRTYFQQYASDGAFIELDGQTELIVLCESMGVDLERCWRLNTESGERHLYGFPVNGLPGLKELVSSSEEMYLCILFNNGNTDNVLQCMNILVRDMIQPVESQPDAGGNP